jgi:flagellar motor switch protein FliM
MASYTTYWPHSDYKLYDAAERPRQRMGKHLSQSRSQTNSRRIIDGISLAARSPRMHKTGLLALADTYGLDRRELQHLKLLAENFFNDLRDRLAIAAGIPIRLGGLAQSLSAFKDICPDVPLCRRAFFGTEQSIGAMVTADQQFAGALVDSLISGKCSPGSAERKLTAMEENLFANTFATACTRSVAHILAGHIGTESELRRIQTSAGTDLPEWSDQMVLARIGAEMSGGGGELELALPLSRMAKARRHPTFAQPASSAIGKKKAVAQLGKARAELVAVLGRLPVTLDSLGGLGPGSILALRPLRDGAPILELHCGGQVLFSGAVVEHRGWRRFLIQQTGDLDERSKQSNPGV